MCRTLFLLYCFIITCFSIPCTICMNMLVYTLGRGFLPSHPHKIGVFCYCVVVLFAVCGAMGKDRMSSVRSVIFGSLLVFCLVSVVLICVLFSQNMSSKMNFIRIRYEKNEENEENENESLCFAPYIDSELYVMSAIC